MGRKATIIGKATDYEGRIWDVRESRETAHGWPLLIGWPAGERGPGYGGPQAIVTNDLADYLESMRMTPTMIDLPLGRTTIKRLRALLDHYWYQDNAKWWKGNPDGPGRSDAARSNWRKRMGIKTDRWTASEDEALPDPDVRGTKNTKIAAQLQNRTEAGVRARRRRRRLQDNNLPAKRGAPLRFPPLSGEPNRDRIINLRRQLYLSLVGLGKLLGVSSHTINRWEKGLREVPGSTLKILDMMDWERAAK